MPATILQFRKSALVAPQRRGQRSASRCARVSPCANERHSEGSPCSAEDPPEGFRPDLAALARSVVRWERD